MTLLEAAKAVVAAWRGSDYYDDTQVAISVLADAIAAEEARIALTSERAAKHSGEFPYGPWEYSNLGQFVMSKQVDGLRICDVRGWGYFQYLPGGGEAEHDALGELIASLPEIVAERDELRAKLEAAESAKPVAFKIKYKGNMSALPPVLVFSGEGGAGQFVGDAEYESTPLYTHPSLPAYTPMTDEELWAVYYDCFSLKASTKFDALRPIEQAVLKRLGVTP